MSTNLHLAGAHRGGAALVHELASRDGAQRLDLTITDPKPGRASALASTLRERGARATPFEARCEDIVATLDSGAPLVLAVDELAPMAQILATRHNQALLAQAVGRGQPIHGVAPVFGVSLVALPERGAERRSAARLLATLAQLAPPASSARIREDGLHAVQLARERARTSVETAARLRALDRARDDELLHRLLWAGESYPLVVAPRTSASPREVKEEALTLAGGEQRAVALLASTSVEFFVVDAPRGTRRASVRLWAPFQAPTTERYGEPTPAAFTD